MVSRRRRLALAIAVTLVVAAWLNAAQERRACGTCSPLSSTLHAMACEAENSQAGKPAISAARFPPP